VSRRREPAAVLDRLGLVPGDVLAGRVPHERLGALLAGPEGAALAGALGELASAEVAAALVALEPGVADRAVRKEVRRALYRLKQRGVPVPARPGPPAAPARPAAGPIEGLVSHVDGRGDRVVWLLRALPTGGTLLVAAQMNEPAGLRDVHVAEVGRKQVRAARQQLEREAHVRLVPADWRTLDALLVEAHHRAGAPDRHRDYLRVRARLTAAAPAPLAEPRSPAVAPLAPDEARAVAATAGAGLLGEPELRTWYPAPEAATPFLDEIARVHESPLVLSEFQQQDRLRDVLHRAAEALFPPAVLARWLEATAYVLAETGRTAYAREACAVAAVLRERPAEAPNVPFVRALVERAFGDLVAAARARDEETRRGALVMTPGEFVRARSSSRPGRSPG
jgi:hypothetical protein